MRISKGHIRSVRRHCRWRLLQRYGIRVGSTFMIGLDAMIRQRHDVTFVGVGANNTRIWDAYTEYGTIRCVYSTTLRSVVTVLPVPGQQPRVPAGVRPSSIL